MQANAAVESLDRSVVEPHQRLRKNCQTYSRPFRIADTFGSEQSSADG